MYNTHITFLHLQAVYRGHTLRRKLREVLEKANDISDDEASFEEEIHLDYLDEVSGLICWNILAVCTCV